jgi:nucleotide-binding universal stress UspA family protein
MLSKLLVPLDGMPQAAVAVRLAHTLAQLTRGQIVLVRISKDELGTADALAYLTQVADELRADGTAVQVQVEHGDTATQIERVAQAQHADVIVMATHGRSGVGRTVLGSVAERLVTRGSLPVVLVRPGAHPLGRLQTLLVPLDGSPGAGIALGMAVALARASGAQLTLTEVVEPIPRYAYVDNYVDPAWDEEARQAAEVYVQALAARLRRAGVQADGHAILGANVAEQLVSKADRVEADLVVMSTHAHRGVARALLGSVADAVVRTGNCPVLLIHQRAEPRPPTDHPGA